MTDFAEALDALREKKPLIHCITNYVTAGDTANMLLAVGASPIMADDPAEVVEVTLAADALVLNLGTLSERHIAAVIAAGKAANKAGIPVTLDPVGVQLTQFRKNAARQILSEIKVSIIRGNLSELLFMGGIPVQSSGVDSVAEPNKGLNLTAAADVARQHDCVCAVTGAEDIITDGDRAVQLLNGTDRLKKVTGAGDMTSALAAAFSAVCDPFSAAAFGVAFMGICGEISENSSSCNGMGSFRAGLFDAAGMDREVFAERIRING